MEDEEGASNASGHIPCGIVRDFFKRAKVSYPLKHGASLKEELVIELFPGFVTMRVRREMNLREELSEIAKMRTSL